MFPDTETPPPPPPLPRAPGVQSEAQAGSCQTGQPASLSLPHSRQSLFSADRRDLTSRYLEYSLDYAFSGRIDKGL